MTNEKGDENTNEYTDDFRLIIRNPGLESSNHEQSLSLNLVNMNNH